MQYQCPECPNHFRTQPRLKKHLRKVHKIKAQFLTTHHQSPTPLTDTTKTEAPQEETPLVGVEEEVRNRRNREEREARRNAQEQARWREMQDLAGEIRQQAEEDYQDLIEANIQTQRELRKEIKSLRSQLMSIKDKCKHKIEELENRSKETEKRLKRTRGELHMAYLSIKDLKQMNELEAQMSAAAEAKLATVEAQNKCLNDAHFGSGVGDCAICLGQVVNRVVVVPCGHATFCNNCLIGHQCPVCRGPIEQHLRVYL